MNIREADKLMQAYKELAQKITEGTSIKVTAGYASVELCEDGAFVEARIWIPRDELDMRGHKID